MLPLILTILFSSLIIVTFRLVARFKLNELEVIVWNYLFATTLGVVIWKESLSLELIVGKPWLGIALLTGVFFILTFYLMSLSAAKAGLAITAVASRMSVVIPVIAGFLLFKDELSWMKVAGIVLTIFSFALIFKPKGNIKVNMLQTLPPFLLFIGIGANDTLMKYAQHHFLQNDESLFLTVVYSVALLIGVIILTQRMVTGRQKVNVKSVLAGLVLGMLNFGATYYFIKGLSLFESVVYFPVVNVSIVSLTAMIGVLFFREKFSVINWVGIFMAIFAIMLISIS